MDRRTFLQLVAASAIGAVVPSHGEAELPSRGKWDPDWKPFDMKYAPPYHSASLIAYTQWSMYWVANTVIEVDSYHSMKVTNVRGKALYAAWLRVPKNPTWQDMTKVWSIEDPIWLHPPVLHDPFADITLSSRLVDKLAADGQYVKSGEVDEFLDYIHSLPRQVAGPYDPVEYYDPDLKQNMQPALPYFRNDYLQPTSLRWINAYDLVTKPFNSFSIMPPVGSFILLKDIVDSEQNQFAPVVVRSYDTTTKVLEIRFQTGQGIQHLNCELEPELYNHMQWRYLPPLPF